MFCRKCGKEIRDDSEFCYSCGSKVEIKNTQETREIRQTISGKNDEQVDLSTNTKTLPIRKNNVGLFILLLMLVIVISGISTDLTMEVCV